MALRSARPAIRRPVRPRRPPLRRATPAKGPARPGVPATPAAPTPPIVDFSSDPTLLQIRALSQRNLAGAQAAATANRNLTLQRYGYDPAMAGLYGDPNTAAAAKANPNSVVAQLAAANKLRETNLNQNLNKSNLWYSSYRGQQLAQNATAYQSEQQSAAEKLRDALNAITGGLAATQQGEAERVSGAESDAYLRAVQFALQYGTGGASAAPRAVAPAARNVAAMRASLRRRAHPVVRRRRP